MSLRLPFSVTTLCVWTVGALAVAYIGLLAVVMSYAAVTIEFSESARNNEAQVAALERGYFTIVERITATDYAAEGYVVPLTKVFVKTASVTALR